MKVKTGSYTGNQTARNITGIGFQPHFVVVQNPAGAHGTAGLYSMTAFPSSGANRWGRFHNGQVFTDSNRFVNFIADGFSIGNGTPINQTGSTYGFLAIAIDETPDFAIGSYVGNDADDRNITGLGFQPDFVHVMPSTEVDTRYKPSTLAGDLSFETDGGAIPAANYIQAFISDGFQVGSALNASGSTYYYFAFKVTNLSKVFTYSGDGNDNRSISGIGIEPTFAWVQRSDAGKTTAAFRINWAGDLTVRMGSFGVANIIQALESDGIQVGTDAIANASGGTYHGFVLTDGTSSAGPSGPEIEDVDPDAFADGETGIVITGSGFSASGNTVLLSPTDDVEDGDAVEQTITAEDSDEITFTAVTTGLSPGTHYVFVIDDDDASNAEGFEVTILDSHEVALAIRWLALKGHGVDVTPRFVTENPNTAETALPYLTLRPNTRDAALSYLTHLGTSHAAAVRYVTLRGKAVEAAIPYLTRRPNSAEALTPYLTGQGVASEGAIRYLALRGIEADIIARYLTTSPHAIEAGLSYLTHQPADASVAVRWLSMLGHEVDQLVRYTSGMGHAIATTQPVLTEGPSSADATIRFLALQGIEASTTARFVTTAATVASLTLTYLTRRPNSADAVLPLLALFGSAHAATLPYLTLRPNSIETILPYLTGLGVEASETAVFLSLLGHGVEGRVYYHADGVAAVEITASLVLPYLTLAALQRAAALPLITLQPNAASAALPYLAQQGHTADAALRWLTLRPNSAQASPPFLALRGVRADNALEILTQHGIAREATTRWLTLRPSAHAGTLPYLTSQPVNADALVRWLAMRGHAVDLESRFVSERGHAIAGVQSIFTAQPGRTFDAAMPYLTQRSNRQSVLLRYLALLGVEALGRVYYHTGASASLVPDYIVALTPNTVLIVPLSAELAGIPLDAIMTTVELGGG